jgi:hypothetical protein
MLWRTRSLDEEDPMTLTGLILGAVGILILVVGAVMGMRLRRFLSTAVETRGTVVGFVKQSSSEGGSTKHAQVEFAGAAGETVSFTEASATMGGLAVGSEVPVKYDPASPKKARIASSGRLWGTVVMLIIVGAALLVVGAILLLIG